MINPNYKSSKLLVSVLGIACATFLAYLERDVPELTFSAAIAGYHLANAYIKGRNGGEG